MFFHAKLKLFNYDLISIFKFMTELSASLKNHLRPSASIVLVFSIFSILYILLSFFPDLINILNKHVHNI